MSTHHACLRAARRAILACAAVLCLLLLRAGPSAACDVCAVYTPCDECAVFDATVGARTRLGLRIGIASQYTQFATEQLNGVAQPNPYGEHLYSSITQVLVGYQFAKRVGLQLSLPVIVRSWRRVLADGDIQQSTRGGLGDLSILADVLAWNHTSDHGLIRVDLLGGLKLPTGDAGFLAEELDENGAVAGAIARPSHGGVDDEIQSGVHGHDLAFGSGSVDGLVGLQIFGSWRRLFGSVTMQYKITTTGAYDYRYANDLIWSGGPGAWLLLDPKYTFSAQALLTGETKGNDTQKGVRFDDTGMTALYCGPALNFTWGTSLSAEVAAPLPVLLHNTGYQIVPDFRLRSAVVWRF